MTDRLPAQLTEPVARERVRAGRLGRSLGAALWPFVAGRVVVLLALAAARLVADHTSYGTARTVGTSRAGLFSWDASWYLRIAEHGYSAAGRSSLRFFPLLPALGRGLSDVLQIGERPSLLLVTSVASLAALTLLHHLVRSETGDEALARRSVWFLALFPAAFVLVMGYSEAVLLVASVATFVAVRRRQFAWAVVPAFAAGLCRPVGLLLALPVLVECVRARPGPRAGGLAAGAGGLAAGAGWLARGAAVLAAPAGTFAYLAWAKRAGQGFFTPLDEQLSSRHRGTLADPFLTGFHDLSDVLGGHHFGTALHAPFAVLFVVLVVVIFRRWPVSYGAYAALTLAVALSAPNLDSLERYALGCFPFALALASITGRRKAWVPVIVASGAVMFGLAVIAFLGHYVP